MLGALLGAPIGAICTSPVITLNNVRTITRMAVGMQIKQEGLGAATKVKLRCAIKGYNSLICLFTAAKSVDWMHTLQNSMNTKARFANF